MTRIIQITDPHLGPDKEFRLAGVQTFSTFEVVVDEALRLNPDLLLVTGDISAHSDFRSYELFFEKINATGVPMAWLPGNHDTLSVIETVSNATPYKKFHDIGNCRIFLMDSVTPDSPDGEFSQAELDLLKRLLSENTQDHALVCMHHHPIPVGSVWLDKQCIANAEDFLQIVEADDRVRGVHWGHIHQAHEEHRRGVLYTSSPSTCIQFKPNSPDFALDDQLPGFRILDIDADGSLRTEVRRTLFEDFCVELESEGY